MSAPTFIFPTGAGMCLAPSLTGGRLRQLEKGSVMACPSCGCKVHYQFNSEDSFAGDDERLERCAACGAVFDIEDAADDEDDEHPAADALRWAGFGPEDNRAMGEGLQPTAGDAA